MRWNAVLTKWITGSENGTIRIWVCDDFYRKKPISFGESISWLFADIKWRHAKNWKKKLSAKQPLFLRASKNANAIKPKSWSEDKTGEWDYGEKPRALKNRFLEGKPNVSFFHLKSRKDTEKKTILTILSKNCFLQHQKSTVASTCFYY